MKILFVTDLYPIKQGEKTTAKTLHNFVKTWSALGHQVDVVKPNFVLNSFLRKKPFYKTGEYEFEGVWIFNVNYFSPFLFDIRAKIPFGFEDYDVVVAHMPSGIIFANKLLNGGARRALNKKMICAVHNSDLEVLQNPLYRFYFKPQVMKAYENADKIACRSFVIEKKFHKLCPQFSAKTFVANSGVEAEIIVDFPSVIARNEVTKQSILTCANLIKRKNIDKLIEAVGGQRLKIIGDGAELKRLQKLARVARGGENIEFLGRLAPDKVVEEMRKADIFILPSVGETFGMVYLEAMASGCITVCIKNDGVDGIIVDGVNGFLTEPIAVGIAETILRIKNCKNLDEIRKNALETAKKYTSTNCAQSYLDAIY